jgi:hypothetical protein
MRHVAQVMDFNSTEDQPALKKRGRINIDDDALSRNETPKWLNLSSNG